MQKTYQILRRLPTIFRLAFPSWKKEQRNKQKKMISRVVAMVKVLASISYLGDRT